MSRVLWGGRTVIGLSLVATLLAYTAGVTMGLAAGFSRTIVDPIIMRFVDVILVFPPLVFLMVLATGAGHGLAVLIIGIAIVLTPGIARIVRSATLEVSVRGYVEAAVARGESSASVMVREILPNIMNVILADLGVRLTYAVLLVAAVNFLGLGLQPPIADWSLMVSENRPGITMQPFAVAVPALLIASLAIGINLVADGVARSLGTSVERVESKPTK